MQAAWVRFASTGDPNGPGLPLWPRHATAGDPLMVLGDTAQAGVEGRTRELDFVEQFLRSARP